MDESLKYSRKTKKRKSDKKEKKSLAKDKLTSKVNDLEEKNTKEKVDNIYPKNPFSTELGNNFHTPQILILTPHKHDDTNKNKSILPNTKRKFSGDKTSQDGEIMSKMPNDTYSSEVHRIRTKSLPQPPSPFAVNDPVSAPLPIETAKKEQETPIHELLNKKFSLAPHNDIASAPICFDTYVKKTTDLQQKTLLTITFSEPISVNACESDMPRIPVQVIDRTYVHNSPRKKLQRSNSVTETPRKEFSSEEEEASYFKHLYTSMKNAFKDKLPSANKKANEKESPVDSHPQSQPQMLSLSKQLVNTKLSNKTDPESKHNVVQNLKKQSLDAKNKPTDGTSGQKFAKLPPHPPVKTHESNIKTDNQSKLVNQKLPPTTHLNKPVSKIAINHPNNSELDNLKIQLYKQQEQLNQLMIEQGKQQPMMASYAPHNIGQQNKQPSYVQHNIIQQNKPQSMGGSYLQSNKGSSLHTILQLVKETERPTTNFSGNLTGAIEDNKDSLHHKYIYDETDQ